MIILRVFKKFNSIFSKNQKKQFFLLFLMMIFAGLLETLSVSLMLPFAQIILYPENYSSSIYAKYLYQFLNTQDYKFFIMILAVFMAFIYILKNLYLIFQTSVLYKFSFNSLCEMEVKLLQSFLNRPYSYFINMNSSDIMRIILKDSELAFNNLTYELVILSEIIVSLFLLLTVFVISPFLTILVGVILSALAIIIQIAIKNRMGRAGIMHQKTYSIMNKCVLQSFQGIKEIKLMNKENYYVKRFLKAGRQYVNSKNLQYTLITVPKYIIEAIFLGTFFVIVCLLIYNGIDINKLIPAVSVIAMASIRLLPSINKISSNMANMSFGESALDKMLENLDQYLYYNCNNQVVVRKNVFNENIEIKNVKFKYDCSESYILYNANLKIAKGRMVGFVGTSGAGKSTTIDIILGLLSPNSGEVLIDGSSMDNDIHGWQRRIGYIPQSIFLLDGSIKENIAFGVDDNDINMDKIWEAIKDASLYDFVNSLPNKIDTQVGELGVKLSGGQRQRIGIARAIYLNPDVYVLDEATSALDYETESNIMNFVNKFHNEKTILVIAHRLSTLKNCDEIYRVQNGKLIREK